MDKYKIMANGELVREYTMKNANKDKAYLKGLKEFKQKQKVSIKFPTKSR